MTPHVRLFWLVGWVVGRSDDLLQFTKRAEIVIIQIELFVDIAVRGLNALGFDGTSNSTISLDQQTQDIIREKLR